TCPNVPAYPDHVAIYFASIPGRAGDGSSQREKRVWPAGDGVHLLQSRLDHRRRGSWLVAGSTFRGAFVDRTLDWNPGRWRMATGSAISSAAPRGLPISSGFQLA